MHLEHRLVGLERFAKRPVQLENATARAGTVQPTMFPENEGKGRERRGTHYIATVTEMVMAAADHTCTNLGDHEACEQRTEKRAGQPRSGWLIGPAAPLSATHKTVVAW